MRDNQRDYVVNTRGHVWAKLCEHCDTMDKDCPSPAVERSHDCEVKDQDALANKLEALRD
jgi:flavoprotein